LKSKFLAVNTPIFFSAKALHSCSICFFIGITNNFFFKNKVSAGNSNPALHKTPALFAIDFKNSFSSIGNIVQLFAVYDAVASF
jgi:hypothetical protein